MRNRMRNSSVMVLIAAVLMLNACGGGGGGGSAPPPPPVDTTAPTASASPVSGGYIGQTTEIVVLFSETMDTNTLLLGGSMAAASDGGSWSSTNGPDDTLTIRPTTGWTEGTGDLTVDADDLAGNALVSALSLTFTADYTIPSVVGAPPDYTVFANAAAIVVRFSETMDTGSLVLSQDLAPYAGAAVWSASVYANDTLTLWPASEWPAGRSRQIGVEVSDPAGNAAVLLRTYDIATVYVATTGDDAAAGAQTAPVKTLAKAFAIALADYTTAEIHVKSGNYGLAGPLALVEGVSLYGGYAPTSWATRVPATYWSNLSVTSSKAGTFFDPDRVVEAGPGVTNKTVLDGFRINGSSGAGVSVSSALFAYSGGAPLIRNSILSGGTGSVYAIGVQDYGGQPVLENCEIRGSASTVPGMSYGVSVVANGGITLRNNWIGGGYTSGDYQYAEAVYLSGAATVEIGGNYIVGGTGGSLSYVSGIDSWNSSPVIYNNVIVGGPNTTSYARGIYASGGAPVIRNNTIDGGNTPSSSGVYLVAGSTPAIDNNIITSHTSGVCVLEEGAASDPASFRNNDLIDCAVLYADYVTSGGNCTVYPFGNGLCYTAVSDLNSAVKTTQGAADSAGGNVSVDPSFKNAAGYDYHLQPVSPSSVAGGGLYGSSLGWSFSTDRDGIVRTTPWSMGAYEQD